MGLTFKETEPTEVDGRRWCPDFLDNLDKPESDRAGFVIGQLSGRELERIERRVSAKGKAKAKAGDIMARIRAEQSVTRDYVFDAKVISLFGWNLEGPDGATTEIKTWKELHALLMAKRSLGTAPKQLFSDLLDEITSGSKLTEAVEGE